MSAQPNKSLRAGAAAVDITPPAGSSMQGYHSRFAEGVTEPLTASALAVGDGRVQWLLLSLDSIGVDRTFTARVRQSIAQRLLLEPSAITIACSHTHSGPATLPRLGPVAGDSKYLGFLEDQLAAVATTAAGKLEPARWRIGITSLKENVNRRVHKGGSVELGVDSHGPVDNRLRVIRIDRATDLDRSASPLALVVHYACHATSSAGVSRFNPDWPGAMRTALQQVYSENGTQPVICFLQGCAGDLTHRVGRDREVWPEHFEKETWIQSQIIGRLAAAEALQASERSIEFPAENVQAVVQPLSLLFHDRLGAEQSEIQVVRIGSLPAAKTLWFVGLPGEPFTDYSSLIGRHFRRRLGAQPDHVLVSGYTNDSVGYLCTPRAIREGGYEAAVAHRIYHRPAPFSADTQSIVLACSLAGAEKLVGQECIRQTSKFAAGVRRARRWLSPHGSILISPPDIPARKESKDV